MSGFARVSGGIASGKTRVQMECFDGAFPEWSDLLALMAPGDRYEVITVSDRGLTVRLADPHWHVSVRSVPPGYWVAEVHDLDECAKHPEVYIGPMAHTEDPDRTVAVRNALISAKVQALDKVDEGIARHQKKECDNPLCYREVGAGVMYCCKACGDAHEGGYKLGPTGFWPGVLAHSPMCDRRAYEATWPTEVE